MKSPEQLAAELYDVSVPDWEGEIDFYRAFAYEVRDRGQSVLEVACGTRRVTLRLAGEQLLARTGFQERTVYGDFFRNPLKEESSEMIWVARKP